MALGAAAAVEVACLVLFWRGLPTLAWVLHLAACALFLIGLWRLSGAHWRTLARGWTRVDAAIVGVLLVLAFAVRAWQDHAIPEGVWFDEGQRGLEALHILADPSFRPVFAAAILQEPTGFWYQIATLLPVLGRETMALRLPGGDRRHARRRGDLSAGAHVVRAAHRGGGGRAGYRVRLALELRRIAARRPSRR